MNADRPWLGIVRIEKIELVVDKAPKVTLVFMNSGKTPALDGESRFLLEVVDKLPDDISHLTVTSKGRQVVPVFPGTEIQQMVLAGKPLSREELDAIKAGKKLLIVDGEYFYRDRFQAAHHTPVCLLYYPTKNQFGPFSCGKSTD